MSFKFLTRPRATTAKVFSELLCGLEVVLGLLSYIGRSLLRAKARYFLLRVEVHLPEKALSTVEPHYKMVFWITDQQSTVHRLQASGIPPSSLWSRLVGIVPFPDLAMSLAPERQQDLGDPEVLYLDLLVGLAKEITTTMPRFTMKLRGFLASIKLANCTSQFLMPGRFVNITWSLCVIPHYNSFCFQSFKERLFDSALSEKYENLQVDLPSRNNRRYRSVSPSNFDDDDDSDEEGAKEKKLLFLQDPLSRSVYKNLEVYFDRKNLIRDAVGDLGLPNQVNLNQTVPGSSSARANFSFSRSNSNLGFSSRSQSALGRPATSMDFRSGTSMGSAVSARALESSRPQSSLANHQTTKPSGGSSSFFSRRKKEISPAPRAHSEERPEDIRRKIQERFAQIDFNEGTTDYDALFTVTEEGSDFTTQHEAENKAGNASEGNAVKQAEDDKTPKSRLDHLRY